MTTAVRPATTDDIETIQEVARQSWHEAHDHIIGEDAVDEFLDQHYAADTLEENIERQDGIFYVAERNDENVVAFSAAIPWRNSDTTFALGSIYVLPRYWNQGIGSQLLQAIENTVSERGGEKIRLVVMAENEIGINFYESRGYEQIDNHYDDDLEVQGYVYAKTL